MQRMLKKWDSLLCPHRTLLNLSEAVAWTERAVLFFSILLQPAADFQSACLAGYEPPRRFKTCPTLVLSPC